MLETAPATRTQDFFEPLLKRNPSGSEWLGRLLAALPQRARLGELIDEPGALHASLTVPGLEGRRACFAYPVAPPDGLIAWYIEHPERLRWPAGAGGSPLARRLRRALLYDQPPGSRRRAQARARELAPLRSAFAEEWWRFEETFRPDCLLMSDRLVLTVLAVGSTLPAASDWYPQRSALVRGLEAARRLAGARRSGALLISQAPVAEAADAVVRASLPAAAPHLRDDERAELADGYLGNLTWDDAARATLPSAAA